jgi:LMBR1 domain-containing protein 1
VSAADVQGGGVRLDTLWLILYITVAVLVSFIIPFAFFFYENDMDEEAETEGFFDTQAGGALKYTFIVAAVFCVLLGILYAFLHNANVPVTRYAQTFSLSQDVNEVSPVTQDVPGLCITGAIVKNVCAVSFFNWVIPVSFPLYIVAFMAFLGWFFFTIFAGVGFAALPLELIQEYTSVGNGAVFGKCGRTSSSIGEIQPACFGFSFTSLF